MYTISFRAAGANTAHWPPNLVATPGNGPGTGHYGQRGYDILHTTYSHDCLSYDELLTRIGRISHKNCPFEISTAKLSLVPA